MSRGFVKESDQEELPIIPPRAPLPAGEVNYVTPKGLSDLEIERQSLEEELSNLPTHDEDEHRRAATVIKGKLALLQERILSARVISPENLPEKEVRFGSHVKLRMGPGAPVRELQIVGVDEADLKNNKIAFTAPLAKAITGLWPGEIGELKLGNEVRKVEVISISNQ